MKRFIPSLLSTIFLISILAGCSNTADTRVEKDSEVPTAPETIDTRTITDVLDRTITIPKNVQRVVITFNLEEYLAVSGSEGIEKLVGYSHGYWEGRREDAWATFTTAFPQLLKIQDIGYNDNINIESIISLAPDVVIMSSAVNYKFMETELDHLTDAGIAVAFVNYHAQTIDMHRKSTVLIGEIMGKKERAEEISDFYETQMNLVTDRIATLDAATPRPTVYMEFSRGVDTYGNSWADKMWGALIPICGGTNIAAGLSAGNSVDVAPEQVLASNPDLIIFTASPQTDIDSNVVLGYGKDNTLARERLAEYRNRKGWSELSAVQNQNMGVLYHDLSRHIFDFAGAQFLAKMIHPEMFKDVDPEANLQLFFKKYMPVELNGAWTVSLSDLK